MSSYASKNVVFGRSFLNTVIAALKTTATGPLIATAKVRLSHDPSFLPNNLATIAALAAQEADFSGYPAGGSALVVGAPVNLSGTCQGAVTPITYIATTGSPFVGDVVYGYWIDDGTNVIMAEAFQGGISFAFAVPGDYLELVVAIPAQSPQATV